MRLRSDIASWFLHGLTVVACLLPLAAPRLAAGTYDPKHGRWLQRDPRGILVQNSETRVDPRKQSADGASMYEYVKCQPLTGMDPLGEYCCGPDVGTALSSALADFENTFAPLSDEDKCSLCFDSRTEAGWDIGELYQSGTAKGMPLWESNGCGTGTCAGTVAIGSQCYVSPDVNYELWGRIHKVCYDAYKSWDLHRDYDSDMVFTPCGYKEVHSDNPFSLDNATTLADKWCKLFGAIDALGKSDNNKAGNGSCACRVAFTKIGFGGGSPPASCRAACSTTGCKKKVPRLSWLAGKWSGGGPPLPPKKPKTPPSSPS